MDSFEINKIVAAILLVALLIIGIGKLSDIIFHVEKPDTPAYSVDMEQVVATSTQSALNTTEEKIDIVALMSMGDLAVGEKVFKKAIDANIGEVYVATEDQEIVDDVRQNGGQAIITSKNHKTGTDRIFEAIRKIKIANVDWIMNLQGDEPLININDIKNYFERITL